MQSGPRPFWAHNGAIATPNALASGTGLRILAAGGNAVEAAIGAAATMAVVYPHMNGIGGDNVWLIHDGQRGETRVLLAIGKAGRRVSIDEYKQRGIVGELPQRGALSANTPPGVVDGWWEAYAYSSQRLGGRRDWPEFFVDAIRYAEEGYPVTYSQAVWSSVIRDLADQKGLEGLRETYLTPSGTIPLVGQRQRIPALAQTLRQVERYGRDGFYRGLVAESIIHELQAAGGMLTPDDWSDPHAVWGKPLELSYRGTYQLLNTPPPTQGFAALMIMGILEHFPLRTWGDATANYLHVMIESAKLALGVRNRELGDPAFMTHSATALLAPERLRSLAAHIDPQGMTLAGPSRGMDGGTVAIMTADNMGNAVSLIQSIYHDFGAGFVAQRSGVLLQNRGTSFSLNPGQPNSLAPGKCPAHTLSAAMVLHDGRPYLIHGTMGGDGQPQTQSAVTTRVLDYGMDVVQALAAPRWLYGRTWGEAQQAVFLEGGYAPGVVDDLRRRGHDIKSMFRYDDKLGHAQAIAIGQQGSSMAAASDPRSDGGAYIA